MVCEIVVKHGYGSTLAGSEQRFAASSITLGRRPDNDVTFDLDQDRMVSGHHAEVTIQDNSVFIRDLGSRNGTFVNNIRISEPTRIGKDDTVRFGEPGAEIFFELISIPTESELAAAAAPPEPKRFIGEQTLERVVTLAVSRERSKTRYTLGISIACVLIVGMTALAIWSRSLKQEVTDIVLEALERRVEEQRALFENELATLSGKLGQGESSMARLMNEIQQRDQMIQQIRANQQLTDQQREAALRDTVSKIDQLRRQLADADAARRRSADGDGVWQELATRYEKSIFLCVGAKEVNAPAVSGTGFAITADGTLATNAHVVDSIIKEDFKFVIQNSTGRRFNIKECIRHPKYHDFHSPDVGILRVDTKGEDFVPMPIATSAELRLVGIGTHLGTLGFPGELQNEYFSNFDPTTNTYKGVLATFKDGVVGKVTNYKREIVAPGLATVIQHSASLTGGTSGSPMFNSAGKVVAINKGGLEFYYDLTTQIGPKPETKRVKSTSPAEIGFAIRADVLLDIWKPSSK